MSNIDRAECDRLVNASLGAVTYVAPTGAIKQRLITTTTASTATVNGSEVSGGSYTSQTFTPTTSSSGSGCSNNGAISYTNMPAATVGGIELWDSAGTPRRAWWGPLAANKTTGAGDTLTFANGAVVANIA